VEVLAEKRWSNSMLVMKGLTAVEVGVEVGVERLSGDDDATTVFRDEAVAVEAITGA
jgi:hypothetical protein